MLEYDKWRAKQPGHYKNEYGTTLADVGYVLRSKRSIPWDGTFNQPVLPMLDPLHKDSKQFLKV